MILHDRRGLFIATAAIAFAVFTLFMELGFLAGLFESQTRLLRELNADLVVVSRVQHSLVAQETFPRSRLLQAAATPGVAAVDPLYLEYRRSLLRNPETGVSRPIRVVALNPRSDLFKPADIRALLPALATPFTVLYDRRSNAEFGDIHPGAETELAGRRITVAGVFDLGADYYADGNLLTSEEVFFTLFPHRRPDQVTFGAIRLAPSADRDAVLAALESRWAGSDVEVFTREALVRREIIAWSRSTPVGYVFILGVVVGFVIGVSICHQILHNNITDQLPQFATLRALGYRDRDLVGLVMRQALLLGLLGYLLALGLAALFYGLVTSATGVVTVLGIGHVAVVLTLTLAMCLLSAWLAVLKALRTDPAELFP